MAKKETEQPKNQAFKYLCQACTNELTYSAEPHDFGTKTCPKCGLSIQCDMTRWVAL